MKGGLGNFLWEAGRGGSGTVDGLDCSSTSVTNCSTLEQVENDQETSKNATAFLFVSDFLWLSCCLQISQVNLWRKKKSCACKNVWRNVEYFRLSAAHTLKPHWSHSRSHICFYLKKLKSTLELQASLSAVLNVGER